MGPERFGETYLTLRRHKYQLYFWFNHLKLMLCIPKTTKDTTWKCQVVLTGYPLVLLPYRDFGNRGNRGANQRSEQADSVATLLCA